MRAEFKTLRIPERFSLYLLCEMCVLLRPRDCVPGAARPGKREGWRRRLGIAAEHRRMRIFRELPRNQYRNTCHGQETQDQTAIQG